MGSDPDLGVIVRAFMENIGRLRETTERVPPEWDGEVCRAVELMRRGAYAQSAAVYICLSERSAAVHSGLLASLYKAVAASGHLWEASGLLAWAQSKYVTNPAKLPDGTPVTESFFLSQYRELKAAVASPAGLENYLRPISGNPAYRFPRNYDIAVAEYRSALPDAQARVAAQAQTASAPAKCGCYICDRCVRLVRRPASAHTPPPAGPETHAVGRWPGVRAYYQVSPALARSLERASMPNRVVRRGLDFLIKKVDGMGLRDDVPAYGRDQS